MPTNRKAYELSHIRIYDQALAKFLKDEAKRNTRRPVQQVIHFIQQAKAMAEHQQAVTEKTNGE